MKFNIFFLVCITTTTITPSHKKKPGTLNAETLYEKRMEIVALERRWVDEQNLADNMRDFTPTITDRDIRTAYDTYEQLEADWKIAQSQKLSLQRPGTSPLSNSSFFDAIINSPLFKSKK